MISLSARTPLEAILMTDLTDVTSRLILADYLEMELDHPADRLRRDSTHERHHVRWMIRRDMPQVLESEAALTDEWDEEDFLTVLRQRNCIGMVVERGDKVIGHMVYELHKTHIGMLRLAVHPAYQGRGALAAFTRKMASKLSSHRRDRADIEIPQTNLDTIYALLRCGWRALPVNGNKLTLSLFAAT